MNELDLAGVEPNTDDRSAATEDTAAIEREIGRRAIIKHNARLAVETWLDQQNARAPVGQAPAWRAYTAARTAFNEALRDYSKRSARSAAG